MKEESPCKTCPEWGDGFVERCFPTCKKVEEYQKRMASGQARYSDCVKVVPSVPSTAPPQNGAQMSAFERLAKRGRKKSTVLAAIDVLFKKGSPITKRTVADYLGETSTTLEYWFQLLKKEGSIDISGGGPGIPATISLVKKPERDKKEPGMPTEKEVAHAVEHLSKIIVNPCPNHPDREQKIGKNGKRLGVCEECLSTRPSIKNLNYLHDGRKCFVQLYFHEKHLDLKAWLDKEAEENERTIQQQIIFLLKQAWTGRTEPHVQKGDNPTSQP